MNKVFIIAEAGVNHNGDINIARKMIDAARLSGADAVKFQTFEAGQVISKFAPKAKYQLVTTSRNELQLEMARRYELDELAHRALMGYCKMKKILFVSSPFDIKSIELLDKMGLEIFKIPSGEITNLPYLRKIGSLNKRLILSTGMSNLDEVRDALGILTKSGTARGNITVLHCNTAYPTPFKDANLLAMVAMKKLLKVKVGYSDHMAGIEAPIAAVALGAVIVEKHFTLNRNMKGPDHKASLEPRELKAMVIAIRNTEMALGDGIKRASPSERENMQIARKSIVAARDIKKGDVFTAINITAKRPGMGISPMGWDKVIGKVAARKFKKDELIAL